MQREISDKEEAPEMVYSAPVVLPANCPCQDS